MQQQKQKLPLLQQKCSTGNVKSSFITLQIICIKSFGSRRLQYCNKALKRGCTTCRLLLRTFQSTYIQFNGEDSRNVQGAIIWLNFCVVFAKRAFCGHSIFVQQQFCMPMVAPLFHHMRIYTNYSNTSFLLQTAVVKSTFSNSNLSRIKTFILIFLHTRCFRGAHKLLLYLMLFAQKLLSFNEICINL